MKDEEIDWQIYHLVAGKADWTAAELVTASNLPENLVEASMQRLQNSMLIERRDGRVNALSINESLIRCQIKYDSSLPYTIENGVIKTKKR